MSGTGGDLPPGRTANAADRALSAGDADELSSLALARLRAGDPAGAAAALRQAISGFGPRVDLWFNLGAVEEGRGVDAAAESAWRETLALDPRHRRARLRLATLLERGGRWPEAEAEWRTRVGDEPGDAVAVVGLARSRLSQHDPTGAATLLAPLYRALDDPYPAVLLARAQEASGDDAAALEALDWATRRFAGDDMAWRALGQLHKRLGHLGPALAAFERAHALLRTPGTGYALARPEFWRSSRAKLRHDIEQLDWLAAEGITVPDAARVRADLSALLAAVPEGLGAGESFPIPPALRERVADHYNRCLHRASAEALEGGALNAVLDWSALEARYFESGPGLVVIDGFLHSAALERLRRYCLASTFWYDFEHANGYLGAYVHDGFSAPLLAQIAREFGERLPGIFGGHPLLQLWAYHYDSRMSGIDMHADFAAVNVNFWLTPDAANLHQESGGMVVWDREAPAHWTEDDYNRADPESKRAIRAWLEAEGAKPIRIPHRQNRVVIFNSDLFHRTDDIHFAEGFGNRRINVTMLFGRR